MDDEVITWNLKGPKRMKKRKELNALIRNNVKYKSLLKSNSSNNLLNVNGSVNSRSNNFTRLLNNNNESSSENEQFYFSANKSIIREKRRNHFCKIIKMIILGIIITFVLLAGIVLIFSYSKFHELINDLNKELQLQSEQNKKSIDELKSQIKEYDILFKQLNTFENRIEAIERNNSRFIEFLNNNKPKSQNKKRSNTFEKDEFSNYFNYENENSPYIQNDLFNQKYTKISSNRVVRSIKNIDLNNRLNSFLIEYLYNQTDIQNETNKYSLFKSINIKNINNK